MAFPESDPVELARRLDVGTDPATLLLLEDALAVAGAQLDPRCDPVKVDRYPAAYLESIYQLAVKVWDTAARGAVTLDLEGGFALSSTATSGLYRSILGVAQPVMRQGGVIVG